jgi:pimeloyl-ACP methyl ester carboxylesterase
MTNARYAIALVCAATMSPLLTGCNPPQDSPPQNAAEDPACIPRDDVEETVTVDNGIGTLEGTLLLPASCGPVSVVLLASGSNSSDRDGSPQQQYRLFAEALLAEGVGSLRYDDHGIDGSESAAPALADFTFDLEFADLARFIALLRQDERVQHVVVAGHSQGSLAGMLAAGIEPVDGFVSLAGPGRPAGDLLLEQMADNLTAAELAELDTAVAMLAAGELPGELDPPLDELLPVEQQPYLASWLRFDPSVEIAALAAPTLLVQGEADIQVRVRDAELLKEALPSASLLLIGDMCHLLKESAMTNAGQRNCYEVASTPLASALVPAVRAFVDGLP